MREVFPEPLVASTLVGTEQADLVGDGFPNEGFQRGRMDVRNHAGDHIALAAYGADDWSFTGADAARSATATLIPMPVLGQAADESFVNFDDAAKLIDILHESGSNLDASKNLANSLPF